MKLIYNRPPQSPREFQVHEVMIVTSFLECFLCSGQGSMLSMPSCHVILPTTIIPDQWWKARRQPKATRPTAGLGVWSERPGAQPPPSGLRRRCAGSVRCLLLLCPGTLARGPLSSSCFPCVVQLCWGTDAK